MENIQTVNTIAINDDTREIVKTIIDNHSKEKAIQFVKDLSGFTQSQAEGFIILLS